MDKAGLGVKTNKTKLRKLLSPLKESKEKITLLGKGKNPDVWPNHCSTTNAPIKKV